ncbi:MAG: DUF1612 domain-containing protein [Methylobacteriaceae bacterium]|nr:DUF1612 domain-containing protein [Methylobacteriaceae bacterium]
MIRQSVSAGRAGARFDVDALDWPRLATPMARAEDALARLDARIAASPIRDGFLARAHILDARDALWLEGELVPLEDLVLHDAGMDARAPTHELTRAHEALRARRRIARQPPDWAFTEAGFAVLRGEAEPAPPAAAPTPDHEAADASPFDAVFADIDAAMARASRLLAGEAVAPRAAADRPPREAADDALACFRDALAAREDLPPTLAAALALAELERLAPSEPLGRRGWLAPLLAAALLRAGGKCGHLVALGAGLRAVARERRRAAEPTVRLVAFLAAQAAAAEAGLRDHERWLAAHAALMKKAQGRRQTSRLVEAIDIVLARPLVTAGMLAKELGVTPRAGLNLIAELGLRETTGRGRYRAWAVL